MKVCIIGNGLVSLSLAKALVNKGISVDVFRSQKLNKYNENQTIGITRSNIKYFNKEIINIEKFHWKIKDIKIYSNDFSKNEILKFKDTNKYLFSIIKNHQLYEILDKDLKKNTFFNYKFFIDYKYILKQNYKLIINCDFKNEITKKFFSKKIEKKYDSFAYVTIINHKKIQNNRTATQIFTNKGPIAFLPISNSETSVVCSFKNNNNNKIDIIELIKEFNPKYKIRLIRDIVNYELKSSNLRNYYKDNILAFGDLLHKIHPLAGQGFNMSLRDIKELIKLIDKRINLGLELDRSICIDFENQTKDKNYIFSQGIDFIYEFFDLENKLNSNIFRQSINMFGKNKFLNNYFRKFADLGL